MDTTKKRRVIYLSDDEWDQAKRQAAPFLMTVSGYIRSLIVGGRIVPAFVRDEMDRMDQQAARDIILRRVNRKGSGA